MKKLMQLVLTFVILLGLYQGYKIVTFDPSNDLYTLDPNLYQHIQLTTVGYLPLDEIAPEFLEMVVLVEDKRFYKHFGFDPIAIFNAMMRNVEEKSLFAGGSTLSQQLAKNLFYTREKTIERKLYELWTAITLERYFGKDQILEMYVNIIFYGSDANGIAAAARTYFDKRPSELTEEESALLVGLLPAPSVYNPFVNPEIAAKRQAMVLEIYRNQK